MGNPEFNPLFDGNPADRLGVANGGLFKTRGFDPRGRSGASWAMDATTVVHDDSSGYQSDLFVVCFLHILSDGIVAGAGVGRISL